MPQQIREEASHQSCCLKILKAGGLPNLPSGSCKGVPSYTFKPGLGRSQAIQRFCRNPFESPPLTGILSFRSRVHSLWQKEQILISWRGEDGGEEFTIWHLNEACVCGAGQGRFSRCFTSCLCIFFPPNTPLHFPGLTGKPKEESLRSLTVQETAEQVQDFWLAGSVERKERLPFSP